MSTGLAMFDTTIQDSNHWLKDLERGLGGCSRQEAYTALRAVLHALRDRLQPRAAVHFAAQLPTLLRGVYYEGWTLPEKPTRTRDAAEFGDRIREFLPQRFRLDPLMCARGVFATAAKLMSTDEADKVMSQLPEHVGELWPRPVII
jgi:uncharacterized protein (DUF2267 family)